MGQSNPSSNLGGDTIKCTARSPAMLKQTYLYVLLSLISDPHRRREKSILLRAVATTAIG